MKVTPLTRIALGLGVCTLALGSAVLPASADPSTGSYGTLVGLGSDTTQDVLNALATSIGGSQIASYDATGSDTVVTRLGAAALPRANGSGAGLNLLRAAIGQTDPASVGTAAGAVSVTTAQANGLIDFSRSSSGAPAAEVRDDGVLTYVPFAVDAVSYATAANSDIPNDLTAAQITSIYKGEIDRVAVNGSTKVLLNKNDAVPSGSTVTNITTFIPQSGSGTRSYWLGKVGITEANIAASQYPNLKDKDFANVAVQEHKGASLASGTAAQNKGAIVPFSIGQWVAQANGKITDHRAGAAINSVNSKAPTTGSGTAYVLNPAFDAYKRTVYNIVPSVLADDPTSEIAKTFVGANSKVCTQTATISAFGFGLLTGTGASQCGDTSIRAYAPSTSTTTQTVPASATVGTSITLKATVASTGNGGGKVQFRQGTTVLATATLAKGATVATTTWTPTAAGTASVTALFLPSLPGVAASSPEAATNVVVSPASTVNTTTTLAASAKSVVGSKITLTASVSKPAVAGTVTFKDGTKVLGSAKITATANKATFAFTATKTAYQVTAVFTPASTTAKASQSAVLSVKAAKASSTVVVAKTINAKAKKVTTVKVKVSAKGVSATGKVVVKNGKKTLASAKVVKGAAAIKLPKQKAGKYKLTVSYQGSATVSSSSKSIKLTVKK